MAFLRRKTSSFFKCSLSAAGPRRRNISTLADLWEDSAERLTPPEKWTLCAEVVVLCAWHVEHPGCYLSHEEADRALAETYLHPMPTSTFADIWAPIESNSAIHAGLTPV